MPDWLAQAAIARPDGIALMYGNRRWAYAELNESVAEMAGRLASAGVQPGDHVAVLMPNRPEYVCAIHGLARLGAVLVPLNVRLTRHELRRQVERADCAFLLCSRETEAQAAALQSTGRAGAARLGVLSVDPPMQSGVEALTALSLDIVEGVGRPSGRTDGSRESRRRDLDAVHCIIFTSGTTGQPKGAMLTYGNHLASATASAFRLGTLPEDRWLACMPLYHVGGLAIVLRCCLYGTTVVLHGQFNPRAVNQALDTQGVTLVSLVPTMLHRVLEERGERSFPDTLRCVLLGGAAARPVLLQRSLALGVPVATTYGLTESASQVATLLPVDLRRKAGSPLPASRQRWGHCVGKPLMFAQVHILGDGGKELPAGEIGEIAVRGPAVMQGYYRQPEATADALRGGWLHTGDMGYLDQDGDLWVVQRRSDLIVTGGENVYPVEVENVLLEHPGVDAACVVGIEDEVWGQRVATAVVPAANTTLTVDELLAFCATRLAGYKRPRIVRFVASLPQTASGKVRRDRVVDLLSK